MHQAALGTDQLRELRLTLADYPEIAAVWVFGSVARGEAHRGSDLDLGLLLYEPHPDPVRHRRTLLDLASRLEGISPSGRVDLVLLEAQGPAFRYEVLRTGRLVYEADRDRRIDFESTTYPLYFDFLPTLRIHREAYLDGLRSWLERSDDP